MAKHKITRDDILREPADVANDIETHMTEVGRLREVYKMQTGERYLSVATRKLAEAEAGKGETPASDSPAVAGTVASDEPVAESNEHHRGRRKQA